MQDYNGEKYIPIDIKGWGSKKLVDLSLLKNYVNNEDYLNAERERLWDATPPITRKLFKPLAIDENKSYGVVLNSNEEYNFYDKDDTTVLINFADQPNKDEGTYQNNMIDTVKSTVVFDNDVVTIPKEPHDTLDKNTRDYSPWTIKDEAGNIISDDMTCNEFWYIGYDRDCVYETRPNWVMNEEHGGIPAICRAQTFKVDLKDKSMPYGILQSIVLNLNGESLQTGVPLIVEITEAVEYDDGYYPASRDHINNSRYNTTEYGDGKVAKQIAKQYWYPTNTDPGVVAITFDWGARVKDERTYAVVLRSPLNHQPNPYAVGGWNFHCDPDVYQDGDAFMSSNNGYTWLKYGKDENVNYHEGMYAPQDFAFQCHILQEKLEYKLGSFTLYTQPIHLEAIESLQLSVIDESMNGTIEYYAYNPVTDEWVEFKQGLIRFDKEEERPSITVIKAVLTLNRQGEAPYIKSMTIHAHHDYFHEAMLRTLPYTPRTTGILSANTYSHVHCPYIAEDSQNDLVFVDVVKETSNFVHAEIIEVVDIPKYASLSESVTEGIKGEINEIISTTDYERRQELIKAFVNNHTALLEDLKNINVYVFEDNSFGSFNITGDCAYPVLRCSLQPLLKSGVNKAPTIDFKEWLDYTVNYDENNKNKGNTLTFTGNGKKQLVLGHLTIEYNPVFAKNIPSTDYEDYSVKDIDLGFIEEDFDVPEDKILNKEVIDLITMTEALNPIRELFRRRTGVEDQILIENEDFTVDYDNKTIFVNNENFEVGDRIFVKYTPYLVNESISLSYHLTRSNIGNKTNITLKGNYIDYKT